MTSAADPYLSLRDRLIATGWFGGAERELAARLEQVVVELADPVPPGAAVVATGGFGRGIMAIHSDVDLLFLHTGGGEEDLARRVLRPLWDARLKVGHLSHTPRSARTFAGSRLDVVSTFLSARLLAGDGQVFEDFRIRLAGLLDKEHGRILDAMAAEERRRRDSEPYRLMAADLKNGRGGLRTLDMVDWRRRMFEVQSAEMRTAADDVTVRVALTRIRSALHAVAGRAHDTFDFDLREGAAHWLGTATRELAAEVVRLRSEAERMVDAVWWPSIRRVDSSVDSLRPERRGDVVAWFDAAPAFLARLRDVPHLVPFHRHPVGDHTLAAVDRAWALIDGRLDEPVATEAARSVDRPERLVHAALLHDIGKGFDGEHARIGAGMVDEVGRSLGVADDDLGLLRRLVEHHLLLADVATRFDVDDPAVIGWAADRIGDIETLRFLLMLTTVDSLAAAPDVWTSWRAELVRRAFRRLERELVQRGLPDDSQLAVLADRVVEASDGELTPIEVRTHLAGFGPAYRRVHSPELIVEHLRLDRADPVGASVAVRPGAPARLIVIAVDRPRLLVGVAAVLAGNRLSITDARFASRSDGRVFDTFEMVDPMGGEPSAERLEKVRGEVLRVVRGGFDASAALAEKERAYRDLTRTVPVHIDVTRSDDGGGVVEIEAGDRLGLLRDLGLVFESFGMPIIRARIDTRAGVAYDTFQVARLPIQTEPLIDALTEAAGG